jgi:DNA (cytosine-5)-methyltransferase 1
LEHFEEYDFIWSSPPCPSHSRIRNIAGVGCGQNKPIFPDMKLYEEIIFLKQVFNSSGTKFKGKYVVENVVSYYKPLIEPQTLARHYFWANFYIQPFKIGTRGHMENNKTLGLIKGFPGIKDKTLLRNCVEPETGLHIFQCAFTKNRQQELLKSAKLANEL